MANADKDEIISAYDRQMKDFESIRVEVYRLIMGDKDASKRTARRNMLKAFTTYSVATDNLVAKITFGDRVQEISDAQAVMIE